MDTTIFQKFYEEKTALINPTDCTSPLIISPKYVFPHFPKTLLISLSL